MKRKDKFGFLNVDVSFQFDGGSIEKLDDFDKSKGWICEYKNNDGFLYPPIEKSVRANENNFEEISEISNTTRPALLHKLPASHSIVLHNAPYEVDNRNSNAGFIVHALGYLYGTRLQFHDWWHDGRVSIQSSHNVSVRNAIAEDFLSKSYATWNTWSDENKKQFLNILIMHSRAPTYEWEWERFMIEYMVFDGAYKLAKDLYRCNANSHKERFKVVFLKFGLEFDNDKITEIYKLRNNLFHQSLWDQGQACTQRSGSNALYSQMNLSKINDRLIPALLKYNTKYISTNWWSLGRQEFSKGE